MKRDPLLYMCARIVLEDEDAGYDESKYKDIYQNEDEWREVMNKARAYVSGVTR